MMLAASLGEMPNSELVYDWAENWMTMICLNGGDWNGVNEWCAFLHNTANPYPFAPFFEEVGAIGPIEIMTSVAVVLPARIFETAGLLRRLHRLPEGVHYAQDKLLGEHRFTFNEDATIRTETFSNWEYELMERLNACGLAR